MKKKNLFFGGLLMFAMAFSTVALIACGDDDKENEEVVDPLETEKEYYIVGTVTATGGALTGAQVDAGNNLTATTDAQGVYKLTVKESGEYNLKFTATDMESMESKVTIAASTANRTQTTLNVKMAKAISFENVEEVTVEADKETNVEAAQNETSAEEAATTTTVSVPAQAAEEGTTIAAVSGVFSATGSNSAYRDGGSKVSGTSSVKVIKLAIGEGKSHNTLPPYLAQNIIVRAL